MKKLAAIALILASCAVQAETYPAGIYHCVDTQAGNYLIQMDGKGQLAMVDTEDLGVVDLVFSTAGDRLTHFAATMKGEDGKALGEVKADGDRAEIRYPDKSVVQCNNKRPANSEEYPE